MELTVKELNDVYISVSTRIKTLLSLYNEVTIEKAPKSVMDEVDRLEGILDKIFTQLKKMK